MKKAIRKMGIVFENAEELEKAWPYLLASGKAAKIAKELANSYVEKEVYRLKNLLENAGFLFPKIEWNFEVFKGAGASFTAKRFSSSDMYIEEECNDEISCILKEIEKTTKNVHAHMKCKEEIYRSEYCLHYLTVRWEVQPGCEFYKKRPDDIDYLEGLMTMLECAIEHRLRSIYDRFIIDFDLVKTFILEKKIEIEIDIDDVDKLLNN